MIELVKQPWLNPTYSALCKQIIKLCSKTPTIQDTLGYIRRDHGISVAQHMYEVFNLGYLDDIRYQSVESKEMYINQVKRALSHSISPFSRETTRRIERALLHWIQ